MQGLPSTQGLIVIKITCNPPFHKTYLQRILHKELFVVSQLVPKEKARGLWSALDKIIGKPYALEKDYPVLNTTGIRYARTIQFSRENC